MKVKKRHAAVAAAGLIFAPSCGSKTGESVADAAASAVSYVENFDPGEAWDGVVDLIYHIVAVAKDFISSDSYDVGKFDHPQDQLETSRKQLEQQQAATEHDLLCPDPSSPYTKYLTVKNPESGVSWVLCFNPRDSEIKTGVNPDSGLTETWVSASMVPVGPPDYLELNFAASSQNFPPDGEVCHNIQKAANVYVGGLFAANMNEGDQNDKGFFEDGPRVGIYFGDSASIAAQHSPCDNILNLNTGGAKE